MAPTNGNIFYTGKFPRKAQKYMFSKRLFTRPTIIRRGGIKYYMEAWLSFYNVRYFRVMITVVLHDWR